MFGNKTLKHNSIVSKYFSSSNLFLQYLQIRYTLKLIIINIKNIKNKSNIFLYIQYFDIIFNISFSCIPVWFEIPIKISVVLFIFIILPYCIFQMQICTIFEQFKKYHLNIHSLSCIYIFFCFFFVSEFFTPSTVWWQFH